MKRTGFTLLEFIVAAGLAAILLIATIRPLLQFVDREIKILELEEFLGNAFESMDAHFWQQMRMHGGACLTYRPTPNLDDLRLHGYLDKYDTATVNPVWFNLLSGTYTYESTNPHGVIDVYLIELRPASADEQQMLMRSQYYTGFDLVSGMYEFRMRRKQQMDVRGIYGTSSAFCQS